MGYPKRSTKVHVELLDDELCIYDWERRKLHALNSTAAQVWQQCNGQTSPARMAAHLSGDLNAAEADSLVWLSLRRLEKAGLLEEKVVYPQGGRALTRRELLQMAGVSLALLPVIKSIVLPHPAAAQSVCFTDRQAFFGACNGTTISPEAQVRSCPECLDACQQAFGANFTGAAYFDGEICDCCVAF